MNQESKLVYVKALYNDGALLEYNVEYARPLWSLLREVEYYKGIKDLYDVDDFFSGYKVIVTRKSQESKCVISLFICNSNDINKYL